MHAGHPALHLAVLLALPVALAGCAHQADPGTHANAAPTAGSVDAHLAALNSTAPAWRLGQSWVHKWTLPGNGLTFLVKTVVAEAADGGWTLAPDNQTIAAFHGAFVFPTLGHFTKDLIETAGQDRFPWYHFPLAANSTWSDSLVTYDGKHATKTQVQGRVASVTFAAGGSQPDYHIEMSAAGKLLASYDYDAETQWFDEALFYNDTGAVAFQLQMTNTGHGFKGTVYDDAGVPLLDRMDVFAPPGAVPTAPPAQDFTMTADQNRLLVFLISFAAGGGHDAELVAPDGHRYGSQAFDAVLFPIYNDSQVLLVPGQAGTWHTSSTGAGAFVSGGVIQAWGLQERAIQV